MVDPQALYTRERKLREHRIDALQRQSDRLATFRLIIFGAGVLLAWRVADTSPVWLSVPLIAFILAVALHERVRARRTVAERARDHFERGLARLDFRFAGTGATGVEFLPDGHPYAEHLDLFGAGSLFELLTNARSRTGRERLAAWLLHLPAAEETRARQRAVDELRSRWELREALAVIDDRAAAALSASEIEAWASEPTRPPDRVRVLAARLLPAPTVIAVAVGYWIGWWPALILIALEAVVARSLRAHTHRVSKGLDRPIEPLRLLGSVLARVEDETFDTPCLARIHDMLEPEGERASARLDTLSRLASRLDWGRNQFFAPFAVLLLWGTNWTISIERWRARWGPRVTQWQVAVGDFEALLDLAGYAFEHPAEPFATMLEGEARFEATGLGHPLLRPETAVLNDLSLGGDAPEMLLVTGSNMSGKSTLIRSVGTAVVMARAGAPVRARRLALGPLTPGASIRTVDSLSEGESRFFAEVSHIRTAMDVAERSPPALFLLDELLHGTNSHDRRIGAEALIRAFLDRGAIGVVTTHDLALAEIVDALEGRAANAHFEFRVDGGELEFDFRLHPGVVRTGNALEIMRAVGLEV